MAPWGPRGVPMGFQDGFPWDPRGEGPMGSKGFPMGSQGGLGPMGPWDPLALWTVFTALQSGHV